MTARIYLMPFQTTFKVNGEAHRSPKYADLFLGRDWSLVDLGDLCLITVEEIDDDQHAKVGAQDDVKVFPVSLKGVVDDQDPALTKTLTDGKLATKPQPGDRTQDLLRKLVVEVHGPQDAISVGSVKLL